MDDIRAGSAEVQEIWPRDGQILVHLSLIGREAASATLIVTPRGVGGPELRLPTGRSGRDFTARIPLATLATACTTDDQTWDLALAPDDGSERLRVGKHLDDISGKKRIFVYPAQHSAGVRVEPYFTVKDNLSIACRREAA